MVEFPSWDLWNGGLNGGDTVPPIGLTSQGGVSYLGMAQNGHGQGGTPPLVVTGTAFPTRLPHGFLRGQMTVTLRAQLFPGDCGLAVLCNHPTMLAGSGGKGYGFGVESITTTRRYYLCQFNDGVSNGPYGAIPTTFTLLADTGNLGDAGVPWETGIRLRLTWEVDPTELGCVHLVGAVWQVGVWQTVLEVAWYGPTTYWPVAPVHECLYFAGTTNTSYALFRDAALASG